jgi:DNA transposition AAA+ family ATPase
VRSALSLVRKRPVVVVDCQYGMTYKGLIQLLLEAVTHGIPHEGTRGVLERTLMREMRSTPRVICIDEAQRLKAEGIENLRSLHDDPETQFALLLVGGDDCWRVLSGQPMLRSRIHRAVEFRQLTEAQVIDLLPTFHPLLRSCERDVLRFVDRSFAKGNLRNWASFVLTAESICAPKGLPTVSEEVARNAFTLLGTRPASGIPAGDIASLSLPKAA